MRSSRWALQSALITLLTSACTQPPPPLPPLLPSGEELRRASASTLGVGDVVEVRVYQEAELSGLYRVEAHGDFTFPLIGQVQVLNLSPSALAAHIAERLREGYLRDPQVTVFVKESHSKKVFILGKVKKPGSYRYEDGMSVVQAIALAGGLLPIAAPELILIRRPETTSTQGTPEREERFSIPFKAISQGRAQNAPLKPGDILFVPESWL